MQLTKASEPTRVGAEDWMLQSSHILTPCEVCTEHGLNFDNRCRTYPAILVILGVLFAAARTPLQGALRSTNVPLGLAVT